MLDVGDGGGAGEEADFAVAVVFGVEGQSVESPLQVVSHHCHLRQSAVEGLSGGHVEHVAHSEDVAVLLVLQGFGVHVQKAGRVGESCLSEEGVGSGGHEGVEVTVGSLDDAAAAAVLEDSYVLVLHGRRGTFLTSTRVRSFSMVMLFFSQA